VTLTEFLLVRIDEQESAWSELTDLVTKPDYAKLARWMVADCEARRQIVQLHEGATAYDGTNYCTVCSNVDRTGLDTDLEPMPCETLRLLALPYADHPDWRDDWRPWPHHDEAR
jgi:hypothetical protein